MCMHMTVIVNLRSLPHALEDDDFFEKQITRLDFCSFQSCSLGSDHGWTAFFASHSSSILTRAVDDA